jgi:hypothetical protein
MKKSPLALAAFLLALLACNSASAAIYPQAGDVFTITWPHTGLQGPFLMTDTDIVHPVTDSPFLTFCAEQAGTFTPGNQYRVRDVSTASDQGNYKLSGYTAWLYTMFRGEDGWALPALFNTQADKYDALQYAIWAGMVQNVSSSIYVGSASADQQFGAACSYLGNKSWTSAVLDSLYGIGLSSFEHSGWAGIDYQHASGMYDEVGGVRVLNLTTLGGCCAQDQLAIVGCTVHPTSPVPEPTTILVWTLLGLSVCLGTLWRKKANSNDS